MNDWKAIPTIVLVTVLIFGAGVMTGGLLVDQVQKTKTKAPHKSTPPVVVTQSTTTTNEPPKPRPPEILSKKFLQQHLQQFNGSPNLG